MWPTETWPATPRPGRSTWSTSAPCRWTPPPPWPVSRSPPAPAPSTPCAPTSPPVTTGAAGTSPAPRPTTCSTAPTSGPGAEPPGSEHGAAQVGEDLADLGEDVVAVGVAGRADD